MSLLILFAVPRPSSVAPTQPPRPTPPPKVDRRGLKIGPPPTVRQPARPRGGRR